MEKVAPQLGLTLLRAPVSRPEDLEGAVTAAIHQHAEALVVLPDAITIAARERIATLAVTHRLPTAFDVRLFVVAGGLFSYGPSWLDLIRRVGAEYVDKILKGVAPGNLPIQQPTRFEFVLNLRTARALGLSVPASLLSRTDAVLE
jgi:putative ABC transport system substrate-binding protein